MKNSRKIVTGLVVLGLVGLVIYWLSPKLGWRADSSGWKRIPIEEAGLSMLFPSSPKKEMGDGLIEGKKYESIYYESKDNFKNIYAAGIFTFLDVDLRAKGDLHDTALKNGLVGYLGELEEPKVISAMLVDYRGYSAMEAEITSKNFHIQCLFMIVEPHQMIIFQVFSPGELDSKLYDKFIDSIVFD